MKHHLLKKLEQAILLVLVFLLAFEPVLVAARPEHVNAQANLLSYGFTQAQIDEIAAAVAQRGLVNGNLNTRLAQFRATQDELADARSSMVILAVQLLGYQIAVRQSNGLQPRAATDSELQALAEDELRLLIHAAHLNAMWGNDPNAEIGEGDWWFIEHFAERAGDRLQTIIVETQNRGLVAELFVFRQMKMLAVSARSGDAEYAKGELDSLIALLAHQLNATAYYQQHASPAFPEFAFARLVTAPSLREQVQWPVAGSAIKTAMIISQEKMDSAEVQNLAIIIGDFDESDETNNQAGILFITGLLFFDDLDISILQPSLKILSASTPPASMAWLEAILTGNTDNPALFAANIILSIIPVLGVIPDIVSLIVDPDIFIKVVSILGIIFSLGDLVALLGPEALPLAAGSFVADAISAVIKGFFKNSDPMVKTILNSLGIHGGFEIALDLVRTALVKIGDALGSTRDEVFTAISNAFGSIGHIWPDFAALVIRAGGADLLRKLGVSEGTLLAGRILNLGVDLSDEALEATQKIGREFAEAGIELSDNAAKGLGDAVDILGETKAGQLFSICIAGNFTGHGKLASITFSPLHTGLCDQALEVFGSLNRTAKQGFDKIPVEKLNEILTRGESFSVLNRTGEIFGNVRLPVGRTISNDAVEGSIGLISRNLDSQVTTLFNYGFDVGNRSLEILGTSDVVWRSDGITRLGEVVRRYKVGSIEVARIDSLKNVQGIDKLVFDLGAAEDASKVKGALYQLEYSAYLNESNISIARIGDRVDNKDAADIVLQSGNILDVKFREWPKYNEDVIFFEKIRLLEQLSKYRTRYPGQVVEFIFDSRFGNVPVVIREALESAGATVKTFP